MIKIKIIFVILLILLFTSCSSKVVKKTVIKEKSLDDQVMEVYNEAMDALKSGDVLFAAKKFNEVETLYPQSQWAPKSSLLAAYSYYTQDYYGDAIIELKRFIKIFPNHKDLNYAYYLLAICYYEQIVDEKKDLQSIIRAKETFKILQNRYPNTDYALDAEFKLSLIDDILSSKEMYIGRYYLERKKWIAAINRFKTVIDFYDQTIYAPEALHRLVEVYYILGLENESKKYAALLGYNYQSSLWYKNSYRIFNNNYEDLNNQRLKESIKKKENIIKKFISIFNNDD